MNRSVLLAMALFAVAFSTNEAFAGGSSKTQYVRIKNIGAAPVKVIAANGVVAPPESGARLLAQNAVTQFILKKGAGVFGVLNAAGTTGDILEYNFPKSTYVYLQAQDVGGEVTAKFAPPGTRF